MANCDYFTPSGGRCRKKARVAVLYKRGRIPHKRVARRCLPHYIELENRARNPSATFRIVEAKIIVKGAHRERQMDRKS